MIHVTRSPFLDATVCCKIGGAGYLRWDVGAIASARRRPLDIAGQKLPVSFLKHADDQTVAAVWAMLDAVDRQGWRERSFADWGVLAAPHFLGRVSIALAIQRFQQEGAWGVSPHMIPHQSVHAISGTLSQAFQIHGPNFGVGGGANSGADAFLVAATLLADGHLPGVWLVLTGHETEWIPNRDGPAVPAPHCLAVAFALTALDADARGPHLAVGHVTPTAEPASLLGHLPDFHFDLLTEAWTEDAQLPRGRWRLADAHWLEIGREDLP